MSRKIHLEKATRIEGNANIVVETEENQVKTARLMVQDFRGFEKFMQGKQIESAPHMISRICGLCSVSHQVASFKAIENALQLKVPIAVQSLRNIALLGEIIASHSLSYFFLTLPDLMGGSKGVFDLMQSHPDIANDAFTLKRNGNRIVEILCKRTVHPIGFGVGQILLPPSQADLDEIGRIAMETKDLALKLIHRFDDLKFGTRQIPFSESHPINFLILEEKLDQPLFRTFDRAGRVTGEFTPQMFDENVAEMRVDWSFAKFPYLKKSGFPEGIVLVGPLSRLFKEDSVLNDPELKSIRLTESLRDPLSRHLDDVDICRLLEIFHFSKRILQDLTCVDLSQIQGVHPNLQESAQGIGVVEAPRGVLLHSYVINRGTVGNLRLLVATQFNNAYINLMLKDLSQSYVENGMLSKKGEEIVGQCVRLFDPCLTCATH